MAKVERGERKGKAKEETIGVAIGEIIGAIIGYIIALLAIIGFMWIAYHVMHFILRFIP